MNWWSLSLSEKNCLKKNTSVQPSWDDTSHSHVDTILEKSTIFNNFELHEIRWNNDLTNSFAISAISSVSLSSFFTWHWNACKYHGFRKQFSKAMIWNPKSVGYPGYPRTSKSAVVWPFTCVSQPSHWVINRLIGHVDGMLFQLIWGSNMKQSWASKGIDLHVLKFYQV